MIRKISFEVIAILGLSFAAHARAREEYDRTFDKTVEWQSSQRVSLEHKSGDITIRTHPQAQVVIHSDIHVSASDANRAKEFADRLQIRVEPSSTGLSIRTVFPEAAHNVSYCIRYEVTVPESAPLEVRDSFGAVSVTGLKADADIVTSHGQLTFRNGRGTQRLSNSFGRVTVANNVGDVSIETSYGALDAADITGALFARDRFASVNVNRISKGVTIVNNNGAVEIVDSGGVGNVKNSFGVVTVRNFRGNLVANNANGKVEAASVSGTAELRTSFGSVQAADIAGPLLVEDSNGAVKATKTRGAKVKNSFGPVIVDDVAGPIEVEDQNGAVDAASSSRAACEPIIIRTSFSTLRVRIGGDPDYRVSARTTFGKIHTEFPLNVSTSGSNDELNGVIGAGRCEMRLTDSNGNIEIMKPGTAAIASTK